ncbi:MAG: hypothetical protein M1837_003300 [Sclerophora amabilis]|nr:MAG: hypothetical protein M1837_003300 [Sclerophora amabilis]
MTSCIVDSNLRKDQTPGDTLAGPAPILSNDIYMPRSQSLGSMEHGDDLNGHPRNANDQFVGLLQAVTSAAGQETLLQVGAPQMQSLSQPQRRLGRSQSLHGSQTSRKNGNSGRERRRRQSDQRLSPLSEEADVPQLSQGIQPQRSMGTLKRKRGSANLRDNRGSDNLRNCRDPENDHVEVESRGDQGSSLDIRELPPPHAMLDAKAAGVHSAAALFRQPSASSQKYTRPPMSRLFTSLDLPPEDFLNLQAAAKSYMLDVAHPERRACVGHRGTGDTDMVKLRLYHCVEEFLEDGKFGERFFGRGNSQEGDTSRALVWPAQKQGIIAAVTPLLRRMVTNERQRQYAIESRKGGANGKKRNADELDDPSTLVSSARSSLPRQEPNGYEYTNLAPPSAPDHGLPELRDPNTTDRRQAENMGQLQQESLRSQPASKRQKLSSILDDDSSALQAPRKSSAASPYQNRIESPPPPNKCDARSGTIPEDVIELHLNLLRRGVRVCPRIDLSSNLCEGFASLHQHLNRHVVPSDGNLEEPLRPAFEALTDSGLVPINDDASLARAISAVREHVWMDKELKIIAHLS